MKIRWLVLFSIAACRGVGDGLGHGVAPALAAFDLTDDAAWRVADDPDDGLPALELFAASGYRPPHRSPLALALWRGGEFGDCTIDVRVRSTKAEYPHRDLVLVFGHVDAAHFCYAHLASVGDDNAHQVMLVDGADRRPVTTNRTAGVRWGESWHDLRLVRRGEDVTVAFDGETVLTGRAPAWRGRVGFGSFDDTGRFRAFGE